MNRSLSPKEHFGRPVLRVAICALVGLLLANCTSTGSAKVVAQNDDFLIVQPGGGDTYETLAKSFMGNASRAAVLADVNGKRSPSSSRLVVVPIHPLIASAVYPDGYQVVPVLAYHQFARGRSSNLMEIAQSSFGQQMDYLKNNGYTVITLSDLEGFLNGQVPIPKRSVVITIDDGYRSAYEIAYPILRAHGFTATLFVYTDFVGAGLALNWAQIKEMQASGVIDVESHSKTHSSLSRGPADKQDGAYGTRVATEIAVPEDLLGRNLDKTIRQYAYPYGDSSAVVVNALQKRHYEAGLTVFRGGNPSFANPLLLKRDMVYGNTTLQQFQKMLKVYESSEQS